MRKVTLIISELNLNINDTIHLSLVDSMGNLCIANNGFMIDEDITITSDLFEIDLLESELVGRDSSYELKLQSSLKFQFKVPQNENDISHELLSLCRLGCTKGIISESKLDSEFIKKLDLYFLGETPRFTPSQKAVVELYEYYADKVFLTLSTIDIMQLMDTHLATITGE